MCSYDSGSLYGRGRASRQAVTLDIWQLHNPSPAQVQAGDIVQMMEDVKGQGKVRHVSISSMLPDIGTFIDSGSFDTFQIPCSALQREEEQSITIAARAGAGTILRGGRSPWRAGAR